MHFDYTEEHRMLRDSARGQLARIDPIAAYRRGLTPNPEHRRRSLESDADQGWAAMVTGQEDAPTVVEAIVIAEELGYAAHVGAFPSTTASAWALASAAPHHRDRLVSIAMGGDVVASPAAGKATLAIDPEGFRLSGRLTMVQDADIASGLLVTAEGPSGAALLLLPANAPGVNCRQARVIDVTRAWFEVTLEEAQAPKDALVSADPEVVRRVGEIAAVLAAADSLGAAARLLDMTVAYAKERTAFGKPIAAFQAVKHRCADMLIRLESARVAVWYAALALRDGREDASEAAAIAKFYATEAASWISGEALQLHGGIGMTWEHDLHLFLKRAKANELLFGPNHRHREAVAAALGL